MFGIIFSHILEVLKKINIFTFFHILPYCVSSNFSWTQLIMYENVCLSKPLKSDELVYSAMEFITVVICFMILPYGLLCRVKGYKLMLGGESLSH
jgi:hypothetical protein